MDGAIDKTLQIGSIPCAFRCASTKPTKRAREAEEARKSSEQGRATLDAELAALRAEIAATRMANQAAPDTHDYNDCNEAATRDAFIDLLLAEAGWPLVAARDREFEVKGMPNTQSLGYVDYVLWGDDGLPLAVVEAKRTRKDALVGEQQGLCCTNRLTAGCFPPPDRLILRLA